MALIIDLIVRFTWAYRLCQRDGCRTAHLAELTWFRMNLCPQNRFGCLISSALAMLSHCLKPGSTQVQLRRSLLSICSSRTSFRQGCCPLPVVCSNTLTDVGWVADGLLMILLASWPASLPSSFGRFPCVCTCFSRRLSELGVGCHGRGLRAKGQDYVYRHCALFGAFVCSAFSFCRC